MEDDDEFAAYFQERQAAITTIELERRWLSLLELFCQRRDLHWSDCAPADLASFHQELLWTPHCNGRLYATNTLDSILRTLRAFYRWAHRTQRLAADPTATWILPRPPQPKKNSLSQTQILRLLNRPDLSQPLGQRDQVFLELLYYQRLSLRQCLQLTIHDADGVHESVQPHLRLYLEQGRWLLSGGSYSDLLLSRRCRPILGTIGLQAILRRYSSSDLPPLTARLFHQSHREHTALLTERRLQPR